MHGYLRFVLATLVVLSHMGHGFSTINCGVPAVVVFFMLSGFVVNHLNSRLFTGRLRAFYMERFLRIYPLYLTILAIAAVFVFSTDFGDPVLSWKNVVGHVSAIPLNYFMLTDLNMLSARTAILIPAAWSLGLEIQAYILLPLILRSERAKWITGIFSLAVFITGSAFGDAELWCYRLLPGVMFAFLSGAAVYNTLRRRSSADHFDMHFPSLCWGVVLIVVALQALGQTVHNRTLEFSIGFLIGLPLLIETSKLKWRLPFDSWLGQISYGVFLVHFPVVWLFEWLHPQGRISSKEAFLFVMLISLLVSACTSATIERLIWPFRKKLTTFDTHTEESEPTLSPSPVVARG